MVALIVTAYVVFTWLTLGYVSAGFTYAYYQIAKQKVTA